MDTQKVLLWIAESDLAGRIDQALNRAGFSVVHADQDADAVDKLLKLEPQALITDSALLNDKSGEFGRLLKSQCRKTALVLISGSRKLMDRIHALEDGADEFFTPESEIDELIAKVKAIIRRISMVNATPRSLVIRDIVINLDTHEVKKAGRLIDLTYTQFKLLYLLASQRDSVFSRQDILSKVWGENAFVNDRTVDVHVKRLREKLGENNQPSKYIQTIHGLGYRFV
jgi:DNA-binding response OmpR family regulator